jgi:hypothetical protein
MEIGRWKIAPLREMILDLPSSIFGLGDLGVLAVDPRFRTSSFCSKRR